MRLFFSKVFKFIKAQHWFAYFMDLIIVVLGVTIAYQLSVWNEQRKINAYNRVLINSLQRENNLNIEELGNLNNFRREIVRSAWKLYDKLNNREHIHEDSLAPYVLQLLRTSIPIIVTNVLDEQISNNSFNHPVFKTELYKLRGYYNDLILHGTYHWDLKQERYYKYLSNSVDFGTGRIINADVLRSLEFKNNIYFIKDSEQEYTRLHRRAYQQALKVQQIMRNLEQ